eukprot:TRINITY_DN5273_c0_g1_i2.p1 TRINITY_DN5273_c0_g1~~TRINITY_DN5273_c0_g1_i2.p1  ORF type:complete len:155 (-),score=27.97 TRINITY_DN5273_c0_g1_i2:24-488(-)
MESSPSSLLSLPSTQKRPETTAGQQHININPHWIICQLLLSANLFDKIEDNVAFNLTLTSKAISNVTRTFIENKLTFPLRKNKVFTVYHPKKVHTFRRGVLTQIPTSVFQLTPRTIDAENLSNLPLHITHLNLEDLPVFPKFNSCSKTSSTEKS